METKGIRVDNRKRTIEVNDSGDTITVNVDDINLITDVAAFAKEVEEASKKVAERAQEIKADGVASFERIRGLAEYNEQICTGLRDRLDGMLGEGTCLKVFGSIVPGVPAFMDFIGQLVSVIQELADEARAEMSARIDKYTAKYRKDK